MIPKINTAVPAAYMDDSPTVTGAAATFDRLAAGYPGGGSPKGYTTYLMFEPTGSAAVWVALQQVHWTWGLSVIINPDGSTQLISKSTPTATSASAVGTWPTWEAALAPPNDQLPYNGGNPWPK